MHHGISHMLGVPSPMDIKPVDLPPASNIWWCSLETCSNLFIWGPTTLGVTSGGGHRNWSTYGSKQAVRILLECFLVWIAAAEGIHEDLQCHLDVQKCMEPVVNYTHSMQDGRFVPYMTVEEFNVFCGYEHLSLCHCGKVQWNLQVWKFVPYITVEEFNEFYG